jgi:hypothetical protein
MLFLTLARPKLEYTSIETKKVARIQQKFVALYQNHFYTYDHVSCEDYLKCLKLHNPHEKAFISMNYFSLCLFSLKCLKLHNPHEKAFISMNYFSLCLFSFKILPLSFGFYCYSSSFSSLQELLPVYCHIKNFASARRLSAANVVYTNVDIFRKPVTSFKKFCIFLLNLSMFIRVSVLSPSS